MFEKVLFEKIPAKLLLLINKNGNNQSINKLCRRNDITLVWGYYLIEIFLSEGLITREKADGKSYIVSITEKGKEMLGHLKEIKRLLNA